MTKQEIQRRFGEAVRELRDARGWSQLELARRAGMHRTYIGDVERGGRNVSLENIVKIAQGFEVSPAAFFIGFASKA